MQNTIYIWKPIGITPLAAIEQFKKNNPEYESEIISYAGRLDPMAEGILALLIGSENKNREKYLELKKEYESEIIFGISTDTFDSLGLITNINFKEISRKEVKTALETFLGKQKQIYPPYSSKAVEGKPLFWWARNDKLSEIKIPEREIDIYTINLIDYEKISVRELVDQTLVQIEKIKGDFRQKEIIESWKKFEIGNHNESLLKIRIKVSCSSGTYVRRTADDLGKKLGVFAFAYSIKRIMLGEISEKDALKFN